MVTFQPEALWQQQRGEGCGDLQIRLFLVAPSPLEPFSLLSVRPSSIVSRVQFLPLLFFAQPLPLCCFAAGIRLCCVW